MYIILWPEYQTPDTGELQQARAAAAGPLGPKQRQAILGEWGIHSDKTSSA